MNKVTFWMALFPMPRITLIREGSRYWLDKTVLDVIEKGLGERRALLSAGFWSKWGKYTYVKGSERIFADSGGFQFSFMTPGKQKKFYATRDLMYRYQMEVGDVIAGGDIPVGWELPTKQVKYYAELTKENFDYQFKLDEGLDKKFLNIMHGQSPKNMELWFSYVKDYPCMGWAVGAKGHGAYGALLQLLFLYEKGVITKVSDNKPKLMLHMFGMSGKYNLSSVRYVVDRLGLNVDISCDSSSYSLSRYGSLFYEGEIVRFDQIREGKKIVLWDGREITTVPRMLPFHLNKDFLLTSIEHFCKDFRENVIGFYDNGGKDLEAFISKEGIHDLIKWFKFGGTESVWFKFKDKVSGRSETRLSDRLEVKDGRLKAYKKKGRKV